MNENKRISAQSQPDSSGEYVHSLERLLEVLRDQISLGRAVGVSKVAVHVDDLERLLDSIDRSNP